MKIPFLNIEINRSVESKTEKVNENQPLNVQPHMNASFNYSGIVPLGSVVLSFDGEKNFGAMGPPIKYVPNYQRLSTRAWQAVNTNDIARTIIDKTATWIISDGLKLNAHPSKIVLETEGITGITKEVTEKFNDVVESRFDVWANSKHSTVGENETFNELTINVYKHSIIGGDCLVTLRYDNGRVKAKMIDGGWLRNPNNVSSEKLDNGNIITNGVEITPSGKVVRYHIYNSITQKTSSIEAYSSTGLRVAFLVMGTKWRCDYNRGLPVIGTVLETLAKMDRYKEATVAKAEELAKTVYQVVHQNFSDGSNPAIQALASQLSENGSGNEIPVDYLGNQLVANVMATTDKMAFNNPKGARIEAISHGDALSGFEDFYKAMTEVVCATVGIPPNVAMSIYNDSFSASRAATKDWEHTMKVRRKDFANQFYVYVYKFWLYAEILNNKIQAPGYLEAFNKENYMLTEAYESARFTGPNFPHIDPLKEAKAEREKLGALGINMPLTTVERATEILDGGDSDSNAEQFADEVSTFTNEIDKLMPKPKEESTNV